MSMRSLNPTALFLCLPFSFIAQAASGEIDLSSAVVVPADPSAKRQLKAAAMLVDEVERRTGMRWRITQSPVGPGPAILLGLQPAVAPLAASVPPPPGAEGFSNGILQSGTRVYVAGADDRGVLFGTGHLLRSMRMTRGKVSLSTTYKISTAPQTRIRGHQLGYRSTPNSYDGWDVAMWEQYIRDLAVFGTNAVELIPPRSDAIPDSPHFPLPPMDMMIAMSRLLDDYGLDVWVWYPAMDEDYSKPETVEFALREWGEVFRRLPRLDAVLVPAGDPGHTPAHLLFPLLEKQAANLRKHHPRATLWLAPQGFDEKSVEFFFDAVAKRPKWLAGIVYGPQTRISLPDLRTRLPKEIPIRHYPDITHTRQCQYPVPDWDVTWGLTNSREPVNPRPVDQVKIFNTQQKHTIGFIAYSEGCNDDVNKIVWSSLGWNRDTPVLDILREYSRYFIGPSFEDDFAQALFALEQNWRGPAISNGQVEVTYAQAAAMEKFASPAQLLNWRFQQILYRAYYDAYVQRRLVHETSVEQRAMEVLRHAANLGAVPAMHKAAGILDESQSHPSLDLRTRIYQLAEALFQSIRMQSSISLYAGLSGRGNTLDSLDVPLNSRVWLREQFDRIARLDSESARRTEINRLLNWKDPGPGGFYDDLGNPAAQPHVISGAGFDTDPQFFKTFTNFFNPRQQGPKSWWDQAITFYEHPLTMRYPGLDPAARYRVRVVYAAGPLRLAAEGVEIHPYIEKPFEPLEFDVPAEATRDGVLTLQWNRTPGGGGPGRGCQVAEVWLLKRR